MSGMTKDEFNEWAKKHNLSIEFAGILLGASRSNAFKYAKGDQTVSKSVALAARYFDKIPKREQQNEIKNARK